jgi:hypothetical protein
MTVEWLRISMFGKKVDKAKNLVLALVPKAGARKTRLPSQTGADRTRTTPPRTRITGINAHRAQKRGAEAPRESTLRFVRCLAVLFKQVILGSGLAEKATFPNLAILKDVVPTGTVGPIVLHDFVLHVCSPEKGPVCSPGPVG